MRQFLQQSLNCFMNAFIRFSMHVEGIEDFLTASQKSYKREKCKKGVEKSLQIFVTSFMGNLLNDEDLFPHYWGQFHQQVYTQRRTTYISPTYFTQLTVCFLYM